MRQRAGLRCVTWGLRESLEKHGTDAWIARSVAEHLHLPFEYFATDATHETFDHVLDRFLIAGDGRIDHVAGYMDGLKLWADLAASGIKGLVRGDEPFGREPLVRASDVLPLVGMARWRDYPGLPPFSDLGLEHLKDQPIPVGLERGRGEQLPDWRDRLVHGFKIPAVLAALTDIKLAYVEIASPLLTRRIVELAREHPAHLRTGKRLFREVAAEKDISVGYASFRAIASPLAALSTPSAQEFLLDQLSSVRVRNLLSDKFCTFVLQGLHHSGHERRITSSRGTLKRAISRWVPQPVKSALIRSPARIETHLNEVIRLLPLSEASGKHARPLSPGGPQLRPVTPVTGVVALSLSRRAVCQSRLTPATDSFSA